MSSSGMEVIAEEFGCVGSGQSVLKYRLKNGQGVQVELISYGAAITSIQVPDKNGLFDDVILGFDDIHGYTSASNPYMGATVGRVANRIAKGKFTLDGVEYTLAINNGENHLHGGIKSFSRVVWDSHVGPDGRVTFTYCSPHMDEGYPGQLTAQVTYTLTERNELVIDWTAVSSRPTPVNVCNHAYFNLAGHSSGSAALYDHIVELNADKYTPVDAGNIPTGRIQNVVDDTSFYLKAPTRLGDVLHRIQPNAGYDHNFVVNRPTSHENTTIIQHLGNDNGNGNGNKNLSYVGRFHHPESGRLLQVYSDQPGVQFYTGNFIRSDGSLIGKQGVVYSKHGGFCVETQNYPDAVNKSNFPDAILQPGNIYQRTAVYKFSVI